MGITANSEFKICPEPDNGYGYLNPNIIGLGIRALTLELLIHEINEVELQDLFVRFDLDPDVKILHDGTKMLKFKGDIMDYFWTGKVDSVAHLLSPYGINSFILPKRKLTSGKQLV